MGDSQDHYYKSSRKGYFKLDKIKRKYKIATDDSNSAAQRVVRWWFVIRAKESVLEQLQKDWHQMALLTDWKLTPLIQYAKPNLSNNALHQQPNHSQESGTAENVCDPSPEKSAVSDAQQSVSNTNHMANMEQSPSDEQTNLLLFTNHHTRARTLSINQHN